MTSKEAIELLKPLTEYSVNENGIGTFPMVSTPLQAEALELAIKALKDRTQEDNYNLGFGSDRVYIEHLNNRDREHLLNKIRLQGEWIEKEETPASVSYYCSVCKTEGIPITPFCPWCGAKMKGGAEE